MNLLTLEECSQKTSIPISTLRNWAKKEKFPAFKIERNWRVDEEDLNNWLVGKKERSATNTPLSDNPTNLHLSDEKGGLYNVHINRQD
jgi:excisionase family DNA binding protein